jgi:hypothetical protein
LLKLALNSITLTPELSYNIDIPPDSSSNNHKRDSNSLWVRIPLMARCTRFSSDSHWLHSSCKSNYHTITTTTYNIDTRWHWYR